MKINIKLVLLVLFVVVMTFFLIFFAGKIFVATLSSGLEISDDEVKNNNKVSIGDEIPYFDLLSISGSRVRKSDLIGRPTIITFWATWNTESTDQIKIYDDYINTKSINNNTDVYIVAINNQENRNKISSFMFSGGYDVDVLIDYSGEVGVSYGVQTLPTTLFIDSGGIIREIYVGILSQKMLVEKVEKILK